MERARCEGVGGEGRCEGRCERCEGVAGEGVYDLDCHLVAVVDVVSH